MSTTRVHIRNGDEIPADFGPLRTAIRKSTIAIRAPQSEEVFEKSWGRLTAKPGEDVIAVQDSGDEYPIKKDVFAETYEQTAPGRYRKTARSQLVQVPPGVVAVLATLEGELEVSHPDYVVVGPKNEVYANSPDWVAANLEFVE